MKRHQYGVDVRWIFLGWSFDAVVAVDVDGGNVVVAAAPAPAPAQPPYSMRKIITFAEHYIGNRDVQIYDFIEKLIHVNCIQQNSSGKPPKNFY